MQDSGPVIYTIGHSNHPLEDFIRLLEIHNIEILMDVRSIPRSGYADHFNQDCLSQALIANGIRYVFMGHELGGTPQDPQLYDAKGFVLYWKIAASESFLQAMDRLIELARTRRVALMCSEEDPSNCHRRLLLGRVLDERGVPVQHIRSDATAETEQDLILASNDDGGQQALFDDEEYLVWKSTQSVLPKKKHKTSSMR